MSPLIKMTLVLQLFMMIGLQIDLWSGDGGMADVRRVEQQITDQAESNRLLRHRNEALQAEINALKSGLDAIEGKARTDLGMIKDGETFFLFVE